MAFEPLKFTKSWENPQDFPAYEPDETQVRADLQLQHLQHDLLPLQLALIDVLLALARPPHLSGVAAEPADGDPEESRGELTKSYTRDGSFLK